MLNFPHLMRLLPALLLSIFAASANAASFRVQCPTSTITHPNAANNNSEPAYTGPSYTGTSGYPSTPSNVNGAIKCQQVSGGDGYATMGDGTQTYLFAFGPLSGLADIAAGLPGTQFPKDFNTVYDVNNQFSALMSAAGSTASFFAATTPLAPGDPAATDGASSGASPGALGAFAYNGAVGLAPDIANIVTIYQIAETGTTVTVTPNAPLGVNVGDKVVVTGVPTTGYNGTFTVTAVNVPTAGFPTNYSFTYTDTNTGLPAINPTLNGTSILGTVATPPVIDGHVDPRPIMDIGVMNGNMPAPLMAVDEDDEFFLTLTNVGMIMRPDLFEQHTIHWHGYPNASSFYDGVPDASVAINIGGSFTYYYLAPDAGTYFWHCHITPPEHLQMGMVGQLYVRPRQDRVPSGTALYTALQSQQGDLRTKCDPAQDILCTTNAPAVNTGATQGFDKLGNPQKYAYNDGDGSTAYDVEYPMQIHGFDPNFHFVGMTFNPEGFADMKDKYFLLNGRSYPDTVSPGPMATESADGVMHYSQPLPSIVNIPVGGKALLRLSDLDVQEFQTLASLGIPMKVIALNAKMLRDQEGNNMSYYTNSITLGGGESLDVILDASDASCGSTGCAAALYPAGSVFYLYTPNLDHLSNDAENFGGLMTEVHICNSVTGSTFGNTCN